MTDRELKKQLKKLAIAFLGMMLLLIALSVYTLGSTKAELSLYTQSEKADYIKILGLNEDELKQYLSVVSNLGIDSQKNEGIKMLDMATNFIDTMCSAYEAQTNENGQRYYDASIIDQVIKEINGKFIKTRNSLEDRYIYSKEENSYIQNKVSDKTPYCLQIEEIVPEGDNMKVTYQLAYMTDSQMAEYRTGKEVDLEIYTIEATLLKNTDYEYSKYFLSDLEIKKAPEGAVVREN